MAALAHNSFYVASVVALSRIEGVVGAIKVHPSIKFIYKQNRLDNILNIHSTNKCIPIGMKPPL